MPHSCRPVESPRNVQVCELSGRMDAAGTVLFKQALDALVEDVVFKLVVEMNGLELISAACLSALLSYAQQVREHRGDVKFVGASPNVRKVMNLAGFERHFSFFDTEQEALDAFAAGK